MSALAFELPPKLAATAPPEARGLARDGVRLLVADAQASGGDGTLLNARFDELPQLLDPGDLLVVNASATLPASVSGWRAEAAGEPVRVHCSTPVPGGGARERVVELRSADGARPQRGEPGETIVLVDGTRLRLTGRYGDGERLLLARVDGPQGIEQVLQRLGEPIRYGHVSGRWPLSAYQNVYATTPGSSEMASAGRPFTARLLRRLADRGITVMPICLHAGVSSPERHEPPFPEPYAVSGATAARITACRGVGGRVIAVGTTVVRALETVAGDDGAVRAGAGWTDVVIESARGVRAVDGLITGWHEPEASHLLMLEAIAGPGLLRRSYTEALSRGYHWHEFGDSHLILR